MEGIESGTWFDWCSWGSGGIGVGGVGGFDGNDRCLWHAGKLVDGFRVYTDGLGRGFEGEAIGHRFGAVEGEDGYEGFDGG